MKNQRYIFIFCILSIILFSADTSAINFTLLSNNKWKKEDITICTAGGEHWRKKVCSDGFGGVYIVWQDRRSGNWDIYLQRISSEGIPLWTDNGIVISNASQTQSHPQICSDGIGGVFITWYNYEIGPKYGPVFIQKVNSDGEIMYVHNGIALSDDSKNTIQPIICSDGLGGAIIVWRQGGSGIYNLFAQRINSSGHALWKEYGIMITNNSVGYTSSQTIIYDNNQCAIIAWEDDRTGVTKIYSQKIDSNGNLLWDINGLTICNAKKGQYSPQICNDEENGAIIVWLDNRDDPIDNIWLRMDIYVQSIDSNGNLEWGENGTAICVEEHTQTFAKIVSDGEGGAIVFWEDNRTGTNWDLYTQKVNSHGSTLWPYNGMLICNANNEGDLYSQLYIQACSNDKGGAFIAWRDFRNGTDWDIYAQHISVGGIEQWQDNGEPICTELNDQGSIAISSDGRGNAFLVWNDEREDPNGNIHGARIYSDPEKFQISGYNTIIIVGFCSLIPIIIWLKKEKIQEIE